MDGALGGQGLGAGLGCCSLSTADFSVAIIFTQRLDGCSLLLSEGEPEQPCWPRPRLEDVQVSSGCSGPTPVVWSGCHCRRGTRQSSFLPALFLEPVMGWRALRAALVQGKQAVPAATLRSREIA